MAKAHRGGDEEWVGGVVPLPIIVEDDQGEFEPDLLVWLQGSGLLLGQELVRPESTLDRAADVLRAVMAKPLLGSPRRPSRVRVADAELARVLTAQLPEIAVSRAETPEVTAFAGVLNGRFEAEGRGVAETDTELGPLGQFYRAAADLFRAAPWKLLPSDYPLIVDAPELDLSGGVWSSPVRVGRSWGGCCCRAWKTSLRLGRWTQPPRSA